MIQKIQLQLISNVGNNGGDVTSPGQGSTGSRSADQAVQNNPLVQGYKLLPEKNRIHETSIWFKNDSRMKK